MSQASDMLNLPLRSIILQLVRMVSLSAPNCQGKHLEDTHCLFPSLKQFHFGIGINGKIPLNASTIPIVFLDAIDPFFSRHTGLTLRCCLIFHLGAGIWTNVGASKFGWNGKEPHARQKDESQNGIAAATSIVYFGLLKTSSRYFRSSNGVGRKAIAVVQGYRTCSCWPSHPVGLWLWHKCLHL